MCIRDRYRVIITLLYTRVTVVLSQFCRDMQYTGTVAKLNNFSSEHKRFDNARYNAYSITVKYSLIHFVFYSPRQDKQVCSTRERSIVEMCIRDSFSEMSASVSGSPIESDLCNVI